LKLKNYERFCPAMLNQKRFSLSALNYKRFCNRMLNCT
jgi:hypothetical protein